MDQCTTLILWTLAMILVQAISAGVNIIFKVAYNIGMDMRILVVYRFCIATIFILPFAVIEYRRRRPALTRRIVALGILAGLFGGAIGQNLFVESFASASTTYVAAISNLSPAITYILSLILRVEAFNLDTWRGRVRLAGTIIDISGAMVITFYKGLSIHVGSTSVDLLQHPRTTPLPEVHRPVLGAVFAFSSSICFSLFLIILREMTTTYHYPIFSSSLLMSGSSTVLSTIYAIARERTRSSWRIDLDTSVVAIIYSGILASGVAVLLATWSSRHKGPTFVSAFSPFSLVFTAMMGPLLLGEEIHLGSILGGVLVIVGVGLIVWGTRRTTQDQSRNVTEAIEGPSGGEIETLGGGIETTGEIETITIEVPSRGHVETAGGGTETTDEIDTITTEGPFQGGDIEDGQ